MYSSLLIRPPHKHDKTAIASLCGQDLFLIKGVKRWHCIKTITVSSLIFQTQVFLNCWLISHRRARLHYEAMSFRIIRIEKSIPWFIFSNILQAEKRYTRLSIIMNVFNSWVKWKGVVYIFYRQGLNGKLHVHSTWISYILKATACAFHDEVYGTKGNLVFFLNYRRYSDYFNALHFSNNWVFYIKIHKSYSHSKFFFHQ